MSSSSHPTAENKLVFAMECLARARCSKHRTPYQEALIAMGEEIDRLRNALSQSVETVKRLQARDDYVTGCLV